MTKRILLPIVPLFLGSLIYAQQVSMESSTEEMDSAKFSGLIQSYQKLIMTEREELTLIKVDLLGPLLYVMSGIDTAKHNIARVSVERKFRPDWSWVVAFDGQADKNEFTELRYRGGVRYYFNMEKRILKGKSANNFSANYVSTRLNYKLRPPDDDDQLSLDLLFGIQRRIWKYGYIDFDIGIENLLTSFEDRTPGIDFTSSIQLGIAF
ncbi:MAG: hypothetical protein HRT61_10400 [Ekhidna sp.]|nr:hypothetical protein [Ekhidna sp.]